ncbi:uncharacterized protein LOC120287785 isoform X2 [Eucalyptus grandis]|uniref:uncharacterized protein LOC120287785 isoform X2 n=1 Tax=Eucalyptus grandis TaxID=71139 RepID=UPI00192F03F2|nr:uncharacterized protein LOC120287785 isoform X2 [Eucalyptus grandis]
MDEIRSGKRGFSFFNSTGAVCIAVSLPVPELKGKSSASSELQVLPWWALFVGLASISGAGSADMVKLRICSSVAGVPSSAAKIPQVRGMRSVRSGRDLGPSSTAQI